MDVQSNDMQNRWVEGPSYCGVIYTKDAGQRRFKTIFGRIYEIKVVF